MFSSKELSCILDIGTSKVTAIIGDRGVNNCLYFKSYATEEYDGYHNGKFYDVEQLKETVAKVINVVSNSAGVKINRLYVSVPTEVVVVIKREGTISFSKKKRIAREDIEDLFEKYYDVKTSLYDVVNKSANCYYLADNRPILNPIGEKTDKLSGKLSYVLAECEFIKTIYYALKGLDIESVSFVSTIFAETQYLFDGEERDRYVLLVDVGDNTTEIGVAKGDGLIFSNSFSMGGKYLTAKLMEKFNISVDDFRLAEKLKQVVNLKLDADDEDRYKVVYENKDYYFSRKETNKVIRNCLDNFCGVLEESLEKCYDLIPDNLVLNITGGGICTIRGSVEYVSNRLNREVEIVAPRVPYYNKPTLSSSFSILNYATNEQNKLR